MTHRPQILYVAPADPWSTWTNSGFIARVCRELQSRGLLAGAVSITSENLYELNGPRWFSRMERGVRRRLGMSETPPQWRDEREGVIGRLLRQLPPESPVIYHYVRPRIEDTLPLRRYLFLDITVYDAARTRSYGHHSMTKEQVEATCDAHREILGKIDGVLTFSTYAADSIAEAYRYPREKITAIGGGAALSFTDDIKPPENRFAAARILFIGRDWHRKGGPLLLEAFARVRRAVPHAVLQIVGPSQRVEGDGVEFIGPIDKGRRSGRRRLQQLLCSASVFCVPSLCETWGLAYVEAAQCRLPIVGFDDWAMPDIVEHGRSGYLASDHAATGLATGLIELLTDPPALCRMGIAAQQRVRDVLDWPHVVNRLLSAVQPAATAPQRVVPMRSAAAERLHSLA